MGLRVGSVPIHDILNAPAQRNFYRPPRTARGTFVNGMGAASPSFTGSPGADDALIGVVAVGGFMALMAGGMAVGNAFGRAPKTSTVVTLGIVAVIGYLVGSRK